VNLWIYDKTDTSLQKHLLPGSRAPDPIEDLEKLAGFTLGTDWRSVKMSLRRKGISE
jgi:hypothetical protein